MKHVWWQRRGWSNCSGEQKEQEAFWSRFKDASQRLSVSWPSSHDRKSAFRLGGPTPTEHMHTHHRHHWPNTLTSPLSLSLQGVLRDDSPDLRCFTVLTTDRTAVSSFPPECHLWQKTELGSDPSGWDERSHARICSSVTLCRCTRGWDLQPHSPAGSEQHSHNTVGID